MGSGQRLTRDQSAGFATIMAASSRSAPAPRRRCSTRPRPSACRCCRRRRRPSRPWSWPSAGYLRQKLFPAEPSGGVPLFKSLGEPFPQIRFCPTGGIDLAKAPDLPGAANVVVRRRLLGGAEGRDRGRRLAADREAGARSGRRLSVRCRFPPADRDEPGPWWRQGWSREADRRSRTSRPPGALAQESMRCVDACQTNKMGSTVR